MPVASSSLIDPAIGQLLATAQALDQEPARLLPALAAVPDPRARRGMRHRLAVILGLALCAVLAGARSFTAIAEWAADADQATRDALGVTGVMPVPRVWQATGTCRQGSAASWACHPGHCKPSCRANNFCRKPEYHHLAADRDTSVAPALRHHARPGQPATMNYQCRSSRRFPGGEEHSGRPTVLSPAHRLTVMGVAHQAPEGFFDLFPQRTAVVMVDFQNDFCSPKVRGGGPVTNTRNAAAAQRASAFAAHAAGLGARVVYTQQILNMDHLTARQRRWERPDGLCAAGTWGAGLFVEPVPGSSVVVKYRYDCWQSPSFTGFLDSNDIDGLVICGVELVCCVLYAVLGAQERGYHYIVPQDLVSGQDPGDETGNKAVRDYLRFNHPEHAIESSEEILSRWRARTRQT